MHRLCSVSRGLWAADGVPSFAGLYELWPDPAKDVDDPDRWVWSAAVITHHATSLAGVMNERTPVILPLDRIDAWLDPELTDKDAIRKLISGIECEPLQVRAVSTAVNKTGRGASRGPELIEPIDDHGDKRGAVILVCGGCGNRWRPSGSRGGRLAAESGDVLPPARCGRDQSVHHRVGLVLAGELLVHLATVGAVPGAHDPALAVGGEPDVAAGCAISLAVPPPRDEVHQWTVSNVRDGAWDVDPRGRSAVRVCAGP
jgi:hypothetical protein